MALAVLAGWSAEKALGEHTVTDLNQQDRQNQPGIWKAALTVWHQRERELRINSEED